MAIYSTFLNRAWDQVFYDVGLHRLPVMFCIDRAGVTGDDGPSHHGILDLVLLTKVPGMTVLAPSSYEEIAVMLHDALAITSGPVAIRWPKSEARSATGVGSGLRSRLVRPGHKVALVGVGKLLEACEEAARMLALSASAVDPAGPAARAALAAPAVAALDAAVYDLRVVAPIDPALVQELRSYDLVVVAEDGIAEGGAGSAIESALAGSGPRVLRRGVPIAYIPHGRAGDILHRLGLDASGLASSVSSAVAALEAYPLQVSTKVTGAE